MPTLSDTAITAMVIGSLALSVVAIGLFAARSIRDRAHRSARSSLPQGERLEALVETQARSIMRLEAAVRQLAAGQRRLGDLVAGAIQHVGIVRFDAFEDMGGRLSFSAALLDAHGDGVVITSINGRQDTRCYAKVVRAGSSSHNLSDEEEQAIREALGAARQTAEAS